MKKIFILIVSAATLLLSAGCNDFLDRQPITNITPEKYFKTADELAAYTVNYYETFFTTYRNNWNVGPIWEDASTDNLVRGGSDNSTTLRYFSSSNGRFLVPAGQNTSTAFSRIRICNYFFEQVLPKMEAGTLSGSDVNQYVGEMYVMRAQAYFYALRTFGDFPIIENVLPDDNDVLVEASKRAPRNEVARFILSDLDKAETLLADYKRTDVYTPDVSVVYGLKARAYLTMEDWANAEKYAKQAQTGYQVMTESQYLSKTDGFNKPNASWMFGLTFRPSDPNITENDADSSWGSQMIIEVSGSGCGYSANYVGPKRIDSHLFSTIPATDFRRMCFLDPALDEMSKADAIKALEAYTGDPEGVYTTGTKVSSRGTLGCIEIKFRPKDGEYENQYTAFTVAVPLMRVEEMKLIEAEAAGMQNEARGIELLTAFAKTRDANYEYGTHNEAYYNTATSKFQNECWWQRRVELWGEGFATFDIKRLQKGIIRSYAGTNHVSGYQWNIQNTPNWMNLCIIQSETNNNSACTNNETPKPLSGDSDPFAW